MPRLPIRDIDVYYEMTGQGDCILFIHGLGSSTRDWKRQVSAFTPHYQAVTYDVRGHGKSDKPKGPYSIPMFASDAAALIRALDIAPVHVVGLSMGGMIALQLAVTEPELLKSLTVVNSGPELVLRKLKEKWAFFLRRIIVRFLGMRKMGKVLADMLLPNPEQKALHDQFVQRWGENDKRAYLASLKALTGWSVTDRLHGITCPTLIVSADMDYTPVSVKEAYAAKIPGARVAVIRDSRHLTPIEKPYTFNETLRAFLSQF